MVPKLNPTRLIILFSLGIIVLIIILKTKSSSPTSPPMTQPSPSPVPLKGVVDLDHNLRFTNTLPPAPLINSLLRLTISAPDPQIQGQHFAQLFNNLPPEIIDYPNGQSRYGWRANDIELYYYPQESRLAYFNPAVLSINEPLPSSLESQALEFINRYLPLLSPLSLQLVSTTYLDSSGPVAKEVFSPQPANLIQYQYRYLYSSLPILFEPHGPPDVVIEVNQNGIRNFKAKVPPTITQTSIHQDIITQEEMSQRLNNHQYVIIRIDNQQYYEAGPPFDIATLAITSTSLGYIASGGQIEPYYIIRGLARNTSNSKITYQVEIAISARP